MKPAHRSGASVTGMLVKVFLAGVLILLALSFVSFVGGRAVHQFVTRHRGEAPAVGAERAKVDPRWSEAFSSEWEAVLEPRAAYDAGDYGAAYEGFLPFAGHGNAVAQSFLGHMYGWGEGVPQDHGEAVKWYRLAAEQGYSEAQGALGFMFDYGQGVREDHTEAVKWYRLAAEQGSAAAQYNLGVMLYYGQGVREDHTEAVKWYRLAAEQGHAMAQHGLGLRYARGEGVRQNHQEAVKWFRRAAEQGYAMAQYSLGVMYADGEGVPTDYVQAFMWLDLAASRSEDPELRTDAHIASAMALVKMTPDQITEAQRLAREWVEKIERELADADGPLGDDR